MYENMTLGKSEQWERSSRGCVEPQSEQANIGVIHGYIKGENTVRSSSTLRSQQSVMFGTFLELL